MKRTRTPTTFAAVVDLLRVQQAQVDRHQDRDDLWRRIAVRFLVRGILQQVCEATELFAALQKEPLDDKAVARFERVCANGANYFAFLAARARTISLAEGVFPNFDDSEGANENRANRASLKEMAA